MFGHVLRTERNKTKNIKGRIIRIPNAGTKMKLNYKRTIFVGFAFFLICIFWQAYDTIIPKILTDKFGMSQAASGVVMALDNVLAIFCCRCSVRFQIKQIQNSAGGLRS